MKKKSSINSLSPGSSLIEDAAALAPFSVRWLGRFEEWLQGRGYAVRTLETYRRELRPFLAFLKAQGLDNPLLLTEALLERYRNELTEAEVSLAALSHRLVAVRSFLRCLAQESPRMRVLATELALPRLPKPAPPAALSERQVRALLEAPDVELPLGLRDRAILELLYGTAIRNGELNLLSCDQLDLESAELRVERAKGRRGRVLPLGDEAVHWLRTYLERGRPLLAQPHSPERLFLSWRGLALNRSALSLLVRRAAREASLDLRVTPHRLRHACATHMVRRGAGARQVQEILGHANLSSTERYLTFELSDLRRVLHRYHPREAS